MGKLRQLPTKEARLIKQCHNGQPQAQRELYERYAPQMLSLCRRYVQSLEDAEEVLSNAFIKVFRKLEQYSGEGAFGGWIRRIVINEALNFIKYRKNLFVEIDEERCGEESPLDTDNHWEAEHLLRLISELPLGYRTVFNLYAIEGFSHREIAAQLGISENTSKSQLSKARKHLQARLGQNKTLFQEI